MKFFFSVILLMLFVKTASSQIDYIDNANLPDELKNPIETKEGKTESSPYQPSRSPSLTDPEYKNGFLKPTDFFKEKDKDFTMSTDHGLMEREIEFQPDYLEQYQDSGGKGNQKTQYLGRFNTDGKFVEIYCRDHEYVDGDRVAVLVNGEIVDPSIELFGNFQPVLVSLEEGFNRIEFRALNEGISSPNTAEFVVYDEFGNVITRNQWNLATGVKASILINKF